MLIRAVKAWMEHERQVTRIRKAFRSAAPKRNDRKRVQRLAWRLLIWHTEQGHTLESIAAMIDAPNKATNVKTQNQG